LEDTIMNHTLYKCVDCKKDHCPYCDGDLRSCTVCKGAEGSLTSTCTGTPLTEEQQRLVHAGMLDFKDGKWGRYGRLAREFCGKRLPLAVLKSNAGFYIGTFDDEGPCSRESVEYFPTVEVAEKALESANWTQRLEP
jgi:hypothetical protein